MSVLVVTVSWDDFVVGVWRVARGQRLGTDGVGGFVALPDGCWDERGDLVGNDELGARLHVPAGVSARRLGGGPAIVEGPARLDLRAGDRVRIDVAGLSICVEAVEAFDAWAVVDDDAERRTVGWFCAAAAVAHAVLLLLSARHAMAMGAEELEAREADRVYEIQRALAASEEREPPAPPRSRRALATGSRPPGPPAARRASTPAREQATQAPIVARYDARDDVLDWPREREPEDWPSPQDTPR